MVLGPAQVPEFAEEGGYAVPVAADSDALAVAPADLGKEYASFLKDGQPGQFTAGAHTSLWREQRQKGANRPGLATQYIDRAADQGDFAPLGLRTKDGGAFVFFATRFFERQTAAPGYRPKVDPAVKALLTGEVENTVTKEWVSNQVALVKPAGTDRDGVTVAGRSCRAWWARRARRSLGTRGPPGCAEPHVREERAPAGCSAGQGPGDLVGRVLAVPLGLALGRVARAGVLKGFEEVQRVGQRVLGSADPGDDRMGALVPGEPGGRYEDVAAAAMPAEPRMLVHRLGVAVELTGPPLVLVLGGAAGGGEEEHPAADGVDLGGLGDGPDLDVLGEEALQGGAAAWRAVRRGRRGPCRWR